MNKKIRITIIALIAVIVIIIVIIITNVQSKETKEIENQKLTIQSFHIEDREALKVDNTILIGNNIKELENDFYDIKIINTQQGVEILLNKLWYENYANDYIQDDYLAKICRQISYELEIESAIEEFEYVLYKYIKDNYINVRQGDIIEEIKTENLSLMLTLQDSIVKLIIRGK